MLTYFKFRNSNPVISMLPRSFKDAPPDFHATFSASGKTYVLAQAARRAHAVG